MVLVFGAVINWKCEIALSACDILLPATALLGEGVDAPGTAAEARAGRGPNAMVIGVLFNRLQ